MRRIGFPEHLAEARDRLLKKLGYDWDHPGELAAAVRKLSDFYIAEPTASTPWHTTWAQAAYLAYFLPLNYARAHAVALEGVRVGFFDGLTDFVDFGSGLGSAQLAIESAYDGFSAGICTDHSLEAVQLHQALLQDAPSKTRLQWSTDLKPASLPPAGKRMGVFSYVYTELKELPDWAKESEALLIIEPSTREDGRRLLQLRQQLIDEGFRVHAPCTHEGACPLLALSEKDWCHDRIEWQPQEGWGRLEALLPMKNRTLTFSYLLVRKTWPGNFTATETGDPILFNPRYARMTGDPLPEKGKSRQLVCRGPEREFLAWFPARMKEEPELDRGDIIEFKAELEKKSNELRVKEKDQVEKKPLRQSNLDQSKRL